MLEMGELPFTEVNERYFIIMNVLSADGENFCTVNGVRAVKNGPEALEWVNGYLDTLEEELLEEEEMDYMVVNPRVYLADMLDPTYLPDDNYEYETYLLFIPVNDTDTCFKVIHCQSFEEVAMAIEEELSERKMLDIEAVILARAFEIELAMKIPDTFDQAEAERELTGE